MPLPIEIIYPDGSIRPVSAHSTFVPFDIKVGGADVVEGAYSSATNTFEILDIGQHQLNPPVQVTGTVATFLNGLLTAASHLFP